VAEYTQREASDVALQAASYFGKVLGKNEATFIAAKVDGIVFVVASGVSAGKLERALVKDALLGADTVIHMPQILLDPRYHAPSDAYPNSKGSVHLHVQRDVTLGRRVRKKGECLCQKKRGSKEQPPDGKTNMCGECVKVAAEHEIAWSL
jgi:hypothetical protein